MLESPVCTRGSDCTHAHHACVVCICLYYIPPVRAQQSRFLIRIAYVDGIVASGTYSSYMESYVESYMESSVVSGIRCYLEVYIRALYQHSSYLFSCLCILDSQYTEFHLEYVDYDLRIQYAGYSPAIPRNLLSRITIVYLYL